jgi:hypothetical protein
LSGLEVVLSIIEMVSTRAKHVGILPKEFKAIHIEVDKGYITKQSSPLRPQRLPIQSH